MTPAPRNPRRNPNAHEHASADDRSQAHHRGTEHAKLTRPAVLRLITIMLTAIYTTKFPILAEQGFWKMAHEARTDWSMLLGALFLLIVGAGRLSIDAQLSAPTVEVRH